MNPRPFSKSSVTASAGRALMSGEFQVSFTRPASTVASRSVAAGRVEATGVTSIDSDELLESFMSLVITTVAVRVTSSSASGDIRISNATASLVPAARASHFFEATASPSA